MCWGTVETIGLVGLFAYAGFILEPPSRRRRHWLGGDRLAARDIARGHWAPSARELARERSRGRRGRSRAQRRAGRSSGARRTLRARESAFELVEPRQELLDVVSCRHRGQPDDGHLEHRRRLRGKGEVFHLAHQRSEHAAKARRLTARAELADLFAFFVGALEEALGLRRDLENREVAQKLEQGLGDASRLGAAGGRGGEVLEGGARIAGNAGLDDRLQQVSVDEVENLRDDFVADLLAAVGHDLIEQRLRVAHRALAFAGDRRERLTRNRDALGPADLRQSLAHRRKRDAAQIVALAAREDRERDLLRIRRREDEEAPRRGLFEGLQQRVERRRREHVDFVDDEDPVAAGRSGVADRLDDLAHVVDAGAARGVDFLNVGRAALGDLDAGGADAAGRVGRALLAVQAPGDQAGEGRLADATRACEQDRVGDASALDRVAERTRDMALARDLLKGLRPPFASDDLVAHSGITHRLGSTGREDGPRVDRRACRSQPSPCCGCFLPDLTGFTGSRTRTGPCGQHSALAAPKADGTRRAPEFQTAPRLARSPRVARVRGLSRRSALVCSSS